jgi:asparagine synthase (glutamine-hydrolysing)
LKQGHRGKSGLGGIIDLAVLPNLPRPVHVALSQMRPDGLGWKRSFAIHPDFARDMRLDERMEALGYNPSRQPRAGKATQMARMFDRGNRHQAGAMMMGFEAVTGVQVRDPLGDRKIVEFCYAIPDDQFYRDGIDRWLVRRMMARRLPAEILNAPRGEQAADWHLRLKRDAARFEEELSQFAADPSVASRIDVARLRAALKALPDNTPLTPADHPDLQIARFGFGFAMARFVRAIEGRNS